MFKELHEILIAVPIVVASISSLVDKIIKVYKHRQNVKNGGTVKVQLNRMEGTLKTLDKRIGKVEKDIRLSREGWVDITGSVKGLKGEED